MAGLISTNTFWTLWLFVHLILAVGLLGALTHQAMAVALPVRQPAGGIVTRFRRGVTGCGNRAESGHDPPGRLPDRQRDSHRLVGQRSEEANRQDQVNEQP